MEKPVAVDESAVEPRKSRFGSTLTLKGKALNTDTSKVSDDELLHLALMAALVKDADQ